MRNKLAGVLAAGALGVSSVAMANVQQPDFYVGAQMGHMDTSVKTQDVDGSALTGVTGGLFTGLKYNLNNDFFMGAEANVQFSDADFKADGNKTKINEGWGLGILGGVNVTPATSFYGRVGYHETKFKYKDADFSEDNWKKTFNGVRFGVGSETALTDQPALRMELTRTHYSSETINDIKYKTTENLVQVGLKFKF